MTLFNMVFSTYYKSILFRHKSVPWKVVRYNVEVFRDLSLSLYKGFRLFRVNVVNFIDGSLPCKTLS